MKKMLVIGVLFLTFHVHGANWFKEQYKKAQSLINGIIDLSEKTVGKYFKDKAAFAAFKKRSDELQKKMNAQIDAMLVITDDSAAQEATKIYNQILQEHTALIESARTQLSSSVYRALLDEIDQRKKLGWFEFSQLYLTDQLLSIQFAYEKESIVLNATNPYRSRRADVLQFNKKLAPEEQEYRIRKLPIVKSSLERALGQSLRDSQVPTIGLAFSGGGYRAMIATLGYAKALTRRGLLDATMYMSMLSGSTWFGSKFMYSPGGVTEVEERDLRAIGNNQFNMWKVQERFTSDPSFFVNQVVWPKFIFGQPISSIDLYGAFLSDVLFAPFGDARNPRHLSKQRDVLANATKPFPLYTSVHHVKSNVYDWYEFNPYYVRHVATGLAIPTWGFGRACEKGSSTDFAPEQTMGYFNGICGSAFTASIAEAKKVLGPGLKERMKSQSGLEAVKLDATRKMLGVLADVPAVGSTRVLPASLWNPWYKISTSLFSSYSIKGYEHLPEGKTLTLVDAGVDFNIPIPPLADPTRKLDLIIIGDASGDVHVQGEFKKALAFLEQQRGVQYQAVVATLNFAIYKPFETSGKVQEQSKPNLALPSAGVSSPKVVYTPSDKGPVVVYVSFAKDSALIAQKKQDPQLRQLIEQAQLEGFDERQCAEKGPCATFNFAYTPEDYRRLSGIAEFNLLANSDALINVIREIVAKKK